MNILALGSHPDDIEVFCAGTLLKYKKQGHRVYRFQHSERRQIISKVYRYFGLKQSLGQRNFKCYLAIEFYLKKEGAKKLQFFRFHLKANPSNIPGCSLPECCFLSCDALSGYLFLWLVSWPECGHQTNHYHSLRKPKIHCRCCRRQGFPLLSFCICGISFLKFDYLQMLSKPFLFFRAISEIPKQ